MQRKPEWLKVKMTSTAHLNKVNKVLNSLKLNTVCQAANCPNRLECFSSQTATFMILGTVCTRHCKFCNVKDGHTSAVDLEEPQRIAQAVKALDLKHTVITSVTRDDLNDQGTGQFIACIKAIRTSSPQVTIEVLTPDFKGNKDLIRSVAEACPDIYNHNIETVSNLYQDVRPEASYKQSLNLLEQVKEEFPKILTKSGIMLGLGETRDQVETTLKDLKQVGCNILTIGQYLPPSKDHYPLQAYIDPEEFKYYEEFAKTLGFDYVASSPLVRSSYKAAEAQNIIKLKK